MSTIYDLRTRMGISQSQLATELGMTQSNVSHLERGCHPVSPAVACRIIELARRNGLSLTFNDLYRDLEVEKHR